MGLLVCLYKIRVNNVNGLQGVRNMCNVYTNRCYLFKEENDEEFEELQHQMP